MHLALEFRKPSPTGPQGHYKVWVLCTAKYGFELRFVQMLDIISTVYLNVIWFVGS